MRKKVLTLFLSASGAVHLTGILPFIAMPPMSNIAKPKSETCVCVCVCVCVCLGMGRGKERKGRGGEGKGGWVSLWAPHGVARSNVCVLSDC